MARLLPRVATEPGLFLIDRPARVYYRSVPSMPFGRTPLDELIEWIPRLLSSQVPARGEVPGPEDEMGDDQ